MELNPYESPKEAGFRAPSGLSQSASTIGFLLMAFSVIGTSVIVRMDMDSPAPSPTLNSDLSSAVPFVVVLAATAGFGFSLTGFLVRPTPIAGLGIAFWVLCWLCMTFFWLSGTVR